MRFGGVPIAIGFCLGTFFAAGLYQAPTAQASPESDMRVIAQQSRLVVRELTLLRRELSQLTKRCNDPIGGI